MFPAPASPPAPDPGAGRDAAAWLATYVPRLRAPLRRAVRIGTLGGVLVVAQAALLARLCALALQPTWSPREAAAWLLALLPVLALRFACARRAERAAFDVGADLRRQLRSELLAQAQRLGPLWLRGQPRGDLLLTLVDGVEALEAYYARCLPGRRIGLYVTAGVLLAVFAADWLSGLVLLGTAPLIPWFMLWIGRDAEALNQRQWQRLARLSARLLDTLQGLTTLRLLGASRREAAVVESLSQGYRSATMKVLRVAFVSSAVLELLCSLGIALVAIGVGFRLLGGGMATAAGLFVLLLAPEFYAPLRALGTLHHLRMDAVAAAQRMRPMLERPTGATPSGTQPPRPGPPRLRLRDLHLRHDDGRVALRGCSFDAPAGCVTALVGASGAGKSSLLELVLGLARPQHGCVEVDGVALHALDAEAWRASVALLPQRPHLFAASIADNLRLARPDADDAALRRAADAACALEFIDALPRGFGTLLGERGAGLSGGQLQRLALARVLLRDAPLVLLDEPTASLDAELQRRVLESLRVWLRGRTVLMVAHRLRTLELASRVVVLEAGRVVEQGAPRQLRDADGAFARLWRADAGLARP